MADFLASVFRPAELAAIYRVKQQFDGIASFRGDLATLPASLTDLEFCYAVLNKVSRSFALVIQQLPQELRDCICIFYLVLRGLDSVEDDESVPIEVKVPLLRSFHEKLEVDGWTIDNVGDTPDYRYLMAHFDRVITVYKSLRPPYRATITDITHRMGDGMADFAEKKKMADVAEYNLYCHYVAGLVGIGLIHLFADSGLEDASLREEEELANKMGLFLQKTNIIRDYLEDLTSGRVWWPDDVIHAHGFGSIGEMKDDPTSKESIDVLNHLVSDALDLIPHCIHFMSLLKNESIFRFCAIPQVMAIGTLELLYGNPNVYTGVVKMRKGLTCRYILETNTMRQLSRIFRDSSLSLLSRVRDDDYDADVTRSKLRAAIEAAEKEGGEEGEEEGRWGRGHREKGREKTTGAG